MAPSSRTSPSPPSSASASASASEASFEAAPIAVCASQDLAERGRAAMFDLRLWGQPARGFVLRIDGRPVGYVNRCAHVPTELDWQEGEFLDGDRRWIVCAVHGATYDPEDGRCVGGPCVGRRLIAVRVDEAGAQVRWYPSRDVRPPAGAASTDPDASAAPAAPR